MSIHDKLKSIIKVLKIISICGGGTMLVAYQIRQTCKSLDKIVSSNVLNAEKKYTPEYIYIDDPQFALKMEEAKHTKQPVGLARIWKSLRHSLACRLLWLCRHGNREQRNLALEHLASFKNNKNWDCLKLAQALDKHTAVLLARTCDADLRYFLPPPIHIRRAAQTSDLMSFKFRDMITAMQRVHPHSCIQYFLSKYFANLQEQAMEADSIPTKPDSISERDLCLLCLDAFHHNISLFYNKKYEDDKLCMLLIKMGLLQYLSELMLRYPNDLELDLAVLKILTVLSIHTCLLTEFFQNGLIGQLCRLIKSIDVRLVSSAAVCLANLSGEHCFRPGLYLLHPIYRTSKPHNCDTLLIHGLRGGVFVTWRQRDRKKKEPIGIIDATISDVESDAHCKDSFNNKYFHPDLQQVLEDIIDLDDDTLLSSLEVVLQDIPIEAKRENNFNTVYTATKRKLALKQEYQDMCSYTFCWPKDWLPRDCKNLRILGVNYWSSLSEWLERCPLQSSDITTRAAELAPVLLDAEVGKRNVPIVWLAHSMGGLIVKQLLINSAESNHNVFKKLCDHTKAVLFYSTPHRGSAIANMPRAAAAVLWLSHDVKQLQENSPILLKMQMKFLKLADINNWETISFAETLPTLVTAFKVPVNFVTSQSADLGRGVFYQLPLDHLSICKPATRQSILYTTVIDVIKKVTVKDCELQFSNTYFRRFFNLIWWITRKKAKEVVETIDDTQNNHGLRWFEKILLGTFTDDFSD